MKADYLVLGAAAIRSNGNEALIMPGMHRFSAPAFPTPTVQIGVAYGLIFPPGDPGSPVQLALDVVDSTGRELSIKGTGAYQGKIRTYEEDRAFPGEGAHLTAIANLFVVFSQAGDYFVRLRVGGTELARARLRVLHDPSAGPARTVAL